MSQERANEYVEKMYTDEEFLREICRHGGFNKKADDEEKSRLALQAAKEMGYEMTVEEYNKATENFFTGKGILETIKIFRNMNKVIKSETKKIAKGR